MSTGGVQYAEQTLGVHTVFEEAHATHVQLATCRDAIAQARKARRESEADLADREFELLSQVRAAQPEASQASIDRQVKQVVHTDTLARNTRARLADLSATLDDLDAESHSLDRSLQIKVARMNELGGYFSYLAALKNAQTQGRTEWPSSTT